MKAIGSFTKIVTLCIAAAVSAVCLTGCAGTDISTLEQGNEALKQQITQLQEAVSRLQAEVDALAAAGAEIEYEDYSAEAYEKIKFIDKMASNRDCYSGKDFKFAQRWIHSSLLQAGYSEEDIEYQPVSMSTYISKEIDLEELLVAVESYETDGQTYSRQNGKAVPDENGDLVKLTIQSSNIIVTKKGKSEKQIIIGMHYDGNGTGDNGSGVALGLTTAEKFCGKETPYTLKFIFFTGEESGLHGAKTYAASMSEQEKANTLYMINIDSLVCGDYCYLYGGVQDNETKTVNATEAYDNAVKIASDMGLTFKSNPWTWDNLSPENEDDQFPDYASPTTGPWSDHAPFSAAGIRYLYFEATNWEVPDYTGYGETYLVGSVMNTENDYLEYIEDHFPGRIQHHLSQFSRLLNQLLVQDNINW